ncbi:MAG: hypothetical protein Q9M31_04495 [Mariprofundus sp.]|nr:hypothetical protein [Mariprofundus sp.]
MLQTALGRLMLLLLLCCSGSMTLFASPQSAWQASMQLAATGKLSEARAHLSGALAMVSKGEGGLWQERMQLGLLLLALRQEQAVALPILSKPVWHNVTQTALIHRYLQQHAGPVALSAWTPGLLATLLPGSGHAWLGRWHDAGVTALMVLPMIFLTLWAARRRMGPVTLFFALITAWLWSGTVFSAISLAERGSAEAYLLWWQGLWQASALPGRPW